MNVDEELPKKFKKVYKILFVGEVGCGKTSFIRRYVSNVFSEYYQLTIGVDFARKSIDWDEETTIDLNLWDVSGEGRFTKQTQIFYQESSAAFIFFDVANLSSLDATKLWKEEINESTITKSKEAIPCVLIGNKCDLKGPFQWGKTKEEMDQICKENNYIAFFETSARDRINIDESMNFIIKYIIDHNIEPDIPENPAPVQLTDNSAATVKKRSCC